MSKYFLAGLLVLSLAACGTGNKKPLELGFDPAGLDTTARPQDDFFRYVNGGWLDKTQIPADRSVYTSFYELDDRADRDVRAIIEDAAAGKSEDETTSKVGDFYRAFMDSARVERLGIRPMRAELDRVDALKTPDDVLRYIGYNQQIGIAEPFLIYVDQDERDATRYILYVHQNGLTMPDRDYYLEAQFADKRKAEAAYIEQLYRLAGRTDGARAAADVMALETRLATSQWDRVKNRDRLATYNRHTPDSADKLTPGLEWKTFFREAGVRDIDAFVIRQPSFMQDNARTLKDVPVEVWKEYFRFKLLDRSAPYLAQAFVQANFEFHGRTISGIEQLRPRWKRGVGATSGALGEAVGKLYVARHFQPEAKARMDAMVKNLIEAYRVAIDSLEWMTPETRAQAQEKLSKFTVKIGYPKKWRDYSKLEVRPNDLYGNIARSNRFDYRRMIDKLGKPVDRDEWLMTPQTVNAYYSPSMNEIVFPAGILQPPFFNVAADDAVNYGGIGAVIGHELSHGFDDQGRRSDGEGNLRDWWKPTDEQEFQKRANGLIAQYDAYSPIKGMHVKGAYTLGENIGDLSGLAMAYKAYKRSLNGKEAPVIQGFTGEQRFFIGWGQVWRGKYREDELKRRLIVDEHAPVMYRANGPISNMSEFYDAFDVKPGDRLFRAENGRVKIW